MKTTPWHSLSLVANSTYIRRNSINAVKNASTAANLSIRYRDQADWYGELDSHYIWWFSSSSFHQRQNPIWNLNLGRTVYRATGLSGDLYFKVNNLFNGLKIKN